jgi:hypothetical protein
VTPNAERQRRHRRHKAGDHSLCLPASCEKAGAGPSAPEPVKPVAAPETRGPRGARLWREMAEQVPGPAHRVLLEEACRIADRLDRLDGMLDGNDEWMRLQVAGDNVVVMVDNLLAESRQQATALRGLVAELRAAMPKADGRPAPKQAKGGLSDLSARIAARRGTSAG